MVRLTAERGGGGGGQEVRMKQGLGSSGMGGKRDEGGGDRREGEEGVKEGREGGRRGGEGDES